MYLEIDVAYSITQNVWYQLTSNVRQWTVFFRQAASRGWAATCTSPKRKRGRPAAHSCLGHPLTHSPIPQRLGRKALGQLLATSSAEHAGKRGKLAGEKGQWMVPAICQHQVNVLLVRGEPDAEPSPGEYPSFLHCLWKKVHFYYSQSSDCW